MEIHISFSCHRPGMNPLVLYGKVGLHLKDVDLGEMEVMEVMDAIEGVRSYRCQKHL